MTKIVRFMRNEKGAAIVEYGLALLVLAGFAIAGFNGISAATDARVNATCINVGSPNC